VDPNRFEAAQALGLQEVAGCAVGKTRSWSRCTEKMNLRHFAIASSSNLSRSITWHR
jgi:hypothetical protein